MLYSVTNPPDRLTMVYQLLIELAESETDAPFPASETESDATATEAQQSTRSVDLTMPARAKQEARAQ